MVVSDLLLIVVLSSSNSESDSKKKNKFEFAKFSASFFGNGDTLFLLFLGGTFREFLDLLLVIQNNWKIGLEKRVYC